MKKVIALIFAIIMMLSSLAASAAEYTDKDTVQKVQQALNDVGYNCGTPDGVAGKKTATAISDYQTAKGLTVTGTIDEELLNSLGLGEDTAKVGYRFLDIPWGVSIPRFLSALPEGMTFEQFDVDIGTPMRGYYTADYFNDDERFEKEFIRYASTKEGVCEELGFQIEGYDIEEITAYFVMVPNNGNPTNDEEHTALICVSCVLKDRDENDSSKYKELQDTLSNVYGEEYQTDDADMIKLYNTAWFGENATVVAIKSRMSTLYINYVSQDGDTLQLRASDSMK